MALQGGHAPAQLVRDQGTPVTVQMIAKGSALYGAQLLVALGGTVLMFAGGGGAQEGFNPPPASSTMWIKVAGVWKQATPWIKVAGVWKTATPWIKVGGVWK